MQLTEISVTGLSRLAKSLLRAAKRLHIDNHFALAKEIGVDADSVKVVLEGGRPNTRTASRYRSFLRQTGTDSFSTDEQPTKAFLNAATAALTPHDRANDAASTQRRRPHHLPALESKSALGLTEHLRHIQTDFTRYQGELARLHTDIQNSMQHVTQLIELTESWESDAFIREILSSDPETRTGLAHVLKLVRSTAATLPSPGAEKKTIIPVQRTTHTKAQVGIKKGTKEARGKKSLARAPQKKKPAVKSRPSASAPHRTDATSLGDQSMQP